jgi:hypothetical protein
VANFDVKTSERFMDIKFNGIEMSAGLKKFLIMFTGGNPFYLGRIVTRVKEIALERPSSCVDAEMVAQAILELVYHANGVIHQYLMNFMLTVLDKSRDGYLGILISIAEGHNTQSRIARVLKTKQVDISKGLAKLLELGILTRCGVFYAIEDVMLAFWAKSVYQRRKDLLIDGTFDKMELFRRDIIAHISGYERDCDKPATQRVAELFNLFANELVSIDAKNIRMPHFTKVDIKNPQDNNPMIAASFRGNYWLAQVYERPVNENDIVNYIKTAKASECKIGSKILIALGGMDENSKLLAKELKISIWDSLVADRLFTAYGMKRIVIL